MFLKIFSENVLWNTAHWFHRNDSIAKIPAFCSFAPLALSHCYSAHCHKSKSILTDSLLLQVNLPMRLRIEQAIRVTEPCSSASQVISESTVIIITVNLWAFIQIPTPPSPSPHSASACCAKPSFSIRLLWFSIIIMIQLESWLMLSIGTSNVIVIILGWETLVQAFKALLSWIISPAMPRDAA